MVTGAPLASEVGCGCGCCAVIITLREIGIGAGIKLHERLSGKFCVGIPVYKVFFFDLRGRRQVTEFISSP